MAPTTKIKARKPSKVVKPKKNTKHTTASTRNHRFQTFSERIAKLKIDPIRRRRHVESREEISDGTATHLGRSLDQWKDLNMSQTFTAFAREAAPLCESLPVILHNEEKVMDVLVAYIEKEDGLSLEPLLSLLSSFAHDMDTRFEKHFPRAVATVTSVASRHSDPAVVEWSFTCLAWLFKYLSRLLAPDLRSLYDLMSPYLGKETQKPFIIRFAAESLSFLLRKAAATYERDSKPLDLIVGHILKEYQGAANTSTSDLQRQGVMTLFTESIKGIQGGLHSSGVAVLRGIFKQAERLSDGNIDPLIGISTGALTSLIHHTNAETFRPVQDTVIGHVDNGVTQESSYSIKFSSAMIFTMATVRKGTRIVDWNPLISALRKFVKLGQDSLDLDATIRNSVLGTLASTLQSATIDQVLPALDVFEAIRTGVWAPHFLRFCDLFARLGSERFQIFLLPQFQKFVVEQWASNEEGVCLLLPKLAARGRSVKLICPGTLQASIVQELRNLNGIDFSRIEIGRLARSNLYLAALPHFKLEDDANQHLMQELLTLVNGGLSSQQERQDEFDYFALGICFESLLNDVDSSGSLAGLWPKLCGNSSRFSHLSKFWSNLSRYLEIRRPTGTELEGSHMDELEGSLLQCLSLPSHDIRRCALKIITTIYQCRDQSVPRVLSSAASVESARISLESSRDISMNIRRLAAGYAEAGLDPLMQRAIPSFCFGVLHLQLSQAWEDATITLADISKTTVGEEIITSLAESWLEGVPSQADITDSGGAQTVLDIESSGYQVVSDFECSNLAKVSAIFEQAFESPHGGYNSEEDQFQIDHAITPAISSNARGQALRVLNRIPSLAEKKSRMLVPVLLRWAGNADQDYEGEGASLRWSRKDQKAMLAVFAQFTNPKTLYKSVEVYNALLNLCANGDNEIQRSALKALFAWKDPAVNQYEERLTNLLDEARFREEISVFLQTTEDEETAVRAEHHGKLMPVLLRLLYGRAVAGGKHEQSSRRKATFVTLSRYGEDVLGMFTDIALGSTGNIKLIIHGEVDDQSFGRLNMPPRQQLGMLNMIDDMLETLGPALEPFGVKLLNAISLCTIAASRQLQSSLDPGELQGASLLRSIRQVGLQCVARLFPITGGSEIAAYARLAVEELIAPRLDKFASENTQAVSGVLRLCSTWSTTERTARYLVDFQAGLLDQIAQLLGGSNTKDEVRLFVLQNILDYLLQDSVSLMLKQSHVTSFVRSIGNVLNQQPSKTILDVSVTSLTRLADHISDSTEAGHVVAVCTGLLTKPSKIVSPWTKTGLLRTMMPIFDKLEIVASPQLYNAICGLFSRMQGQENRVVLSAMLLKCCKTDGRLLETARICEDLNAIGVRLDDPDHERRERGFTKIYEHYTKLSLEEWQPIVHNCLFYIRDSDDLVNRTSASQALERFVDAACLVKEDFKPTIVDVLLPGIHHGMGESSELVRAEYLRLLGHLVRSFPDWSAVSDMKVLTVDGDDEASFFTNALHIQQHRRLRALRRLSDEANHLSSANASRILFPLLEHFVFDPAEGDAGSALTDQTVQTLGSLARALNWSTFRATFRRYVGYLTSKEDQEKTILRLLGVLLNGLDASSEAFGQVKTTQGKIDRTQIIKRDFLPPLIGYIHRKDESTVDRRMPVAVTIVKLLLLLPEDEKSSHLAPVLTGICHILRSRSQEARDQTRKTLGAILALVGPVYLGFILKELRSALQRGYQLHVLSFTVHSLLVNVTEVCQPGDLDYCLSSLTSVIMDDIFGITGQEKDAEEYKSGMKEVKSSKSFDTMELLARVTPIARLGQLVEPIRSLLSEKLDSKVLKKLDDLLNRLRKGIDKNPAANSRDILIFCHEIIRNVYSEQDSTIPSKKAVAYKVSKYLIQMETANKSNTKGTTTSQIFKVVSFALNLLRKVLRRHDDLQTPSNLAGFLPIAGDALVQGQEEVQLAAVKFLSTVMKVPLAELDANAPTYVKEAIRLIKAASNMTSDSAKASLELITAVLRERRSVEVREKDIGEILKALKGDIDEPDRQGIIYKFLRAVLARKIMVTEVYGIMDEVGKVVITNPDRNVRESARGAYLQFIIEYPQGRDRWNKQASFFVENLKYERPTGRQSVMELLHQLLLKVQDEVLAQLAFTLFVALVPVQVSDSDQLCRQMAGLLIGKLLERATEEQLNTFLTLMDKWLQNGSNDNIRIAAMQCWMTLLRTRAPPNKNIASLRDELATTLQAEDMTEHDVEDEVVMNALQTLEVLMETTPTVAFDKGSNGIWQRLQTYIKFQHVNVKEISARLLGTFFSHVASSSSKNGIGLSTLPLRGSEGLKLSAADMRQMCYASLRALRARSDESSDTFVAQTVRNLVFLGRCFVANGMRWRVDGDLASDEGNMDDEDDAPQTDSSALGYLFNRLSYIVRQDSISAISRTAAVQCQAALLNHTPTIPQLHSIIRPLYSLTDPSIPQPLGEAHKDLTDKARELLDSTQKKVGTEAYVAALGVARAEAKAKRTERRQKRRIEAVSAPEKWAREKRKKYEVKKARMKVKGAEARGKRRGW